MWWKWNSKPYWNWMKLMKVWASKLTSKLWLWNQSKCTQLPSATYYIENEHMLPAAAIYTITNPYESYYNWSQTWDMLLHLFSLSSLSVLRSLSSCCLEQSSSLRCLELIGLPRGVLRSLLGFYCEEGVVHISDPMARCSYKKHWIQLSSSSIYSRA